MRKTLFLLVITGLLIFSPPPSRVQAQQPSAAAQGFDRLVARAEEARSGSRVAEAIELYQKALSLQPRWAEGWFNLGTLLYDRDNYQEAAVAFKRATELSPKIGTGWAMLGLSEFKLGRENDALTHIRQGRQLGVDAGSNLNYVMRYNEALLQMGKEDFEGAQKTLSYLSKEEVNSEDLYVALGLSVLRIRPSEVPLLDLTTREVIIRVGQAEHLTAQKKFSEAAREYERLISDFPKTPNVQMAYGRFLLDNNEAEKAEAVLQRELENNPRNLLAHLLIADTKLRLKDYAGGIAYAEQAIRLRPQLALGHYLLGSLLFGKGETARAISEMETARAAEPNEAKIYYALGNAYARAGRREEAERARATFVRLNKEKETTANQ